MLANREIERWALWVLEQVARNQYQEDSLVELKRELPDAYKVARRIAGHCNSARDETILWVIGAETDGISGWDAPDMADFLPQIWHHFQGVLPEHRTVSLEYDGKFCTALAFYAARPPYLVSNPAFGKTAGHVIESEIPWRDGTRVRTAKRDEVMRLLLDTTRVPQVETFPGTARMDSRPPTEANSVRIPITVSFDIYIMPQGEERLIFPLHRISAEISDIGGNTVQNEFSSISFNTSEQRRRYQHVLNNVLRHGSHLPDLDVGNCSALETDSELIVNRATRICCSLRTDFDRATWDTCNQYRLGMTLFAGADRIPVKIATDQIEKKVIA